MNVVAAQSIVETCGKLGFRKIQYGPLWTIANHYAQANCRIMVIVSHTSQHDICFAHLMFGQTSMPVYIVTDFKSPFTTFFANNVTIIQLIETGGNTAMIFEKLRNNKNFVLLFAISKPDEQTRIHSGYFYLAQQLRVPIVVAGFDYHLQDCYVSSKMWKYPAHDMSYVEFQTTVEPEIMQHITQICPLLPHKQIGFTEDAYKTQHPGFQLQSIETPDLALLIEAVHGNGVSNKEIVAIISITVIIVMVFIFIYIVVPHIQQARDNKKKII